MKTNRKLVGEERGRFMDIVYALGYAIHPRFDWPEEGIRRGAYASNRLPGYSYEGGRLVATFMIHGYTIVLKENRHGKPMEIKVTNRYTIEKKA